MHAIAFSGGRMRKMRRKKSTRKKHVLVSIILILFLCLAGILVFTKKIEINSYFVKDYEVKGVDISHYQGKVDMEKLYHQGFAFIYIKATEGSKSVDNQFYRNWEKALESSLYAGAYHFFSFDSKGTAQAQHYMETVGNLDGRLAPVVDIEYYGNKEKNPPKKEDVVKELQEYLSVLEAVYHKKPIIYTTQKVYDKYIKENFAEYPLWLRNVYYPIFLETGGKWDFWQYSDTMQLEGYDGIEKNIDVDVFHGSKKQLEEFLVFNHKKDTQK